MRQSFSAEFWCFLAIVAFMLLIVTSAVLRGELS
jgi:hypothetical protein